MSLGVNSNEPVRQVLESLAAACGLAEPAMPRDAPGLIFESAEGLLTLIRPHPGNSARLTVEIEAADASAVAEGEVNGVIAARAVQALAELGGALEEASDWRLGLDSTEQIVLSATFEISAFADTEQALAMIENGVDRARALRLAWDALVRGGRG